MIRRRSSDGLRGRPPRRVEWKGPHRPPGDDVIPADLRQDGYLRLRIDSAWDWMQSDELRAFDVAARPAGQPEVAWQAQGRVCGGREHLAASCKHQRP
jgi:hypothetical protein